MEPNWISVNDQLPAIPPRSFGISVLVAVFDPVYDECSPGNGYEVYEAVYMDGQFRTLASDGSWVKIYDYVTHWMYLPTPPSVHCAYEYVGYLGKQLTEKIKINSGSYIGNTEYHIPAE